MDTDPGTIIDASPDQPEKHVRTYEGDIEMLHRGGTAAVKSSATHPVSVPPHPPKPISKPIPPPPPVEAVNTPLSVTPLQTYSGDFLERVRETRASTATVLAAEQDARQGAPNKDAPKQSFPMARVYAVAGVVLLIAGGAGAYVAYTRYVAAHIPTQVTPTTVAAPILIDDRALVSGTGQVLLRAVAESARLPLTPGTVRLLSTTNTADASSTPEGILTMLHTSAPGILLRNMNEKGSMIGVVSTRGDSSSGGNESAFFILSVASYKDTFAGMLLWEPRMPKDLELLFFPRALAVATSTVATSTVVTPITTVAPFAFVDDTVVNHDVRIYRDTRGQSVMLYGYWNPTTLVIARDPAAFADILGRLSNTRAQPQ